MPITFSDSTIHVGDVGTEFNGTVKDASGEIISLATIQFVEYIFQKPDDTLLTVTASVTTDGTDGKINYTTLPGDIDQSGTWKLQIKLTFIDTVFFSDIVKFKVYQDLPI